MRICVLRLSAIGDCINAASVVWAIQKQNPQARITWIIGPAAYAMLKDLMPEVEFIIYRKSGISELKEFRHLMKDRTFDYLLLMQYALSASLASFMIKADVKIGFDPERSREFHSLFINRRIPSGGGRHMVDAFMGFVAAMDLRPAAPEWDFFFSPNLMDRASEFLGVSSYAHRVVISPCTSKRSKDWPVGTGTDVGCSGNSVPGGSYHSAAVSGVHQTCRFCDFCRYSCCSYGQCRRHSGYRTVRNP